MIDEGNYFNEKACYLVIHLATMLKYSKCAVICAIMQCAYIPTRNYIDELIPEPFTFISCESPGTFISHLTVYCHVTVCLCKNGGHHGDGGRHLASVTRCKAAKAVVKPFMSE